MSTGETLIKVEGVSKKFCRKLSRSMYYGMIDSGRNMLGIPYQTDKLRKDEFWALKDVNFELKRGEVLGLIGKNGSGKSTLLRLLTGIYPPDAGQISLKGRIGALIAVGAGFHPHMSGRENIFLNGTILGMTYTEIKKCLEEIVEFAEIGEFIDAPVATYSSGMKVRLGFSIAVHIEPDILLIDEVLAVGDMGFKIKCINKINQIIKGIGVIFVSHSMQLVSAICTRTCVLENGKNMYLTNEIGQGIDYYNNLFDELEQRITGSNIEMLQNVNISNISSGKTKLKEITVKYNDSLKVEFELINLKKNQKIKTFLIIKDREQKGIMHILSKSNNEYFSVITKKKNHKFQIYINELKLNMGKYSISIVILNTITNEIYCRWEHALIINSEFYITGKSPVFIEAYYKME